MSVSVEVIDTGCGRPAAGVSVALLREEDGRWLELTDTLTDETGRVATSSAVNTGRGRYRLVLDLDKYFAGFGIMPFQSRVETVFRIFKLEERVRVLLLVTSSSCAAHIVLADGADT
jgi:5-hydroxyisourate hydrolase